jgi:hypothetical protein
MDKMFGNHPWMVVAVLFGAPPLLLFAELALLAVVP